MDFFEVLTNNKLNNSRVGEVVSFPSLQSESNRVQQLSNIKQEVRKRKKNIAISTKQFGVVQTMAAYDECFGALLTYT